MARYLPTESYFGILNLNDCVHFMNDSKSSVVLGDGGIVSVSGYDENPHDQIIDRERRLQQFEANKETYISAKANC